MVNYQILTVICKQNKPIQVVVLYTGVWKLTL